MAMRTIHLTKDGHSFVFRYETGCEDDIVDSLMCLAETDSCPIDWLDAATLSFQVTQRAAMDCSNCLGPYDAPI